MRDSVDLDAGSEYINAAHLRAGEEPFFGGALTGGPGY